MQLFNTDGSKIGQTRADAQGHWQATTLVLTEGSHAITARAIDAAGTRSFVSDPLNITVDTIAPTINLTLPSTGSPLTPTTRLKGVANGTGSPLATLQYQIDELPSISITFNPDGTFDHVLDLTHVSDGPHTLTINAVDQAGLETSYQFDITTQKLVAALKLDTAPGGTNTDRLTSNPTLEGRIATTTPILQLAAKFSDAAGDFVDVTSALNRTNNTFTLNTARLETINGKPLTDQSYTLLIQAKTADGNWSTPVSVPFTLDRSAPTSPTGLTLVDAQPTAAGSALLSTTKTPTVTGQAEPGTHVTLWVDGQALPQTLLVDETGVWQVQLAQLADGIHSIRASTTDEAGNTSPLSSVLAVRVLTQVPDRPTIALAPTSDTGLSDRDNRTAATTLTLTGTATPNATIELRDQYNPVVVQTTADALGLWEVTINRLPATYQFTAKATHPTTGASLTSTPLTVTIETQAPLAPQISAFAPQTDSGSSQYDRITHNDTPIVTGQAEANAQVRLFNETGQLVGQTLADSSGNWQITPTALPLGIHYLKAVSTDIAGNVGTASNAFEFAITDNDSLWQGDGYSSGAYEEVWLKVDLNKLKSPGQQQKDPLPPPGSDPGTTNPAAAIPATRPSTPEDLQRNNSIYFGSLHGQFDRFGMTDLGSQGGPPYPYGTKAKGVSKSSPYWSDYMAAYYNAYYPNIEPPIGPDGNPYLDPPDDNTPPLSPPPPLPDFVEKVQILLDGLTPKLQDTSQTVFQQQQSLLLAMAQVIDQHELYRLPGTFGVYSNANGASTRFNAEQAADRVAANIGIAKTSLLEEIYLTKLNLAAKGSTIQALKSQELEKPLAELSAAYAKLRQQIQTDIPLPQKPSTFEVLWQAQDQAGLEQGMAAFQAAFEPIPQAERAVKFLKHLLEAAQQVPALKAELRQGEFLDALMQFGLTVAQLNLSEATGADPLWSFLDTLWRATNAGDVRLGAQQLGAFFKEATTAEKKLKLVQFSDKLIQAAKQAPLLQQQVKDPRFVDTLLGLGGAYAALDPLAMGAVSQEEPLNFFLDTLYGSQTDMSMSKGAIELGSFLSETSTQIRILDYSRELLTSTKKMSESLGGQEYDVYFLSQLIAFAKADVPLDPSPSLDFEEYSDTLLIPMYFTEVAKSKQLTPYEKVLKQLSPVHKLIMNEANTLQPLPGTDDRWDLSDNARWLIDANYRSQFREQWIRGFKDVIVAAAHRFSIPSKLVAAVAWKELGGYPESADDAIYILRSFGIVTDRAPDTTSFSSLSLQIRTAARSLGYDPKNISIGQNSFILSSLSDPKQAIFIAAKYLSDLRKGYLPTKNNPNDLTERDMIGLAGAYNLGARLPKFDDFFRRTKSGFLPSNYGEQALDGLKSTGLYNLFD